MTIRIGEFASAVAEATAAMEEMVFTVGPEKDTFHVDTEMGFIPLRQVRSGGIQWARLQ